MVGWMETEFKHNTLGLLPLNRLHATFPADVKPLGECFTYEDIPFLHGNDEGKCAMLRHDTAHGIHERPEGQVLCIACSAAALLWGQGVFGVIWRVAENEVETPAARLCGHISDVGQAKAHPVGKRTLQGILRGFLNAGRIYIDTKHLGMRTALSNHKGNDTASTSYVKHRWLSKGLQLLHFRPCSQKHSISANTHGTAVMLYAEFLESECFSCHNLGQI